MADFYIFSVATVNGTGTITVNSEVISTLGFAGALSIEAGTTVNVSIALDSGFVSFSTISSNVPGSPFTSSPFSFTMPERDCRLLFDISGEFMPIDGYGLKYEWDWFTYNNKPRRLEIYENEYGGLVTEKRIQNLNYIIGNVGDEPVDKTIIGSKLRFDLIAENTDFEEFLTGNNRKFLAKYYHDTDLIFEGFVNTDRLVMPEKSGYYPVTFEALDGTKSFESIRFIPERSNSTINGSLRYFVWALNQTYDVPKPVNICVNIYETRMDDTEDLFSQFYMPRNAYFTDGEEAKFTDGTRIVNETLYLDKVIERLCKPFMARVFLYRNEWYVIRLAEHEKPSQKFFKFNPDGTFDEEYTLENPFTLACGLLDEYESIEYELEFELGGSGGDLKFGNAERTARLIYNEFTAILKLGVLDRSTAGGIFESKFELSDFFRNSAVSPYPNTYQLRRWDYIRLVPTNTPLFGVNNGIMYVSSGGSEWVEIFGTTANTGLADSNLSWIEADRVSTGNEIFVTQELANKLTINLEFFVIRSTSSTPITPPTGTHRIAIMIKVGDSYLERDTSTTFAWTLTPTIMTFDVTSGEVWNSIEIKDIVVPEDGNVVIRLHELICVSGSANLYSVRYRNFRFNVEQNEALVTSEISSKGITVQDYNRVYPDYITHIGDARTNNSTSAINLFPSNEVSELWSRDGIEQFELLDILVQELANFKGRKNLRIIGTGFGGFPDFRKGIQYNGNRWVCTYFNYDGYNDRSQIELFLVDEQEETS